jgi:hypothetical protein
MKLFKFFLHYSILPNGKWGKKNRKPPKATKTTGRFTAKYLTIYHLSFTNISDQVLRIRRIYKGAA